MRIKLIKINVTPLALSVPLRVSGPHVETHRSSNNTCLAVCEVVMIIPYCQLKLTAYCLPVGPDLWDYVITAVMPENISCTHTHTH